MVEQKYLEHGVNKYSHQKRSDQAWDRVREIFADARITGSTERMRVFPSQELLKALFDWGGTLSSVSVVHFAANWVSVRWGFLEGK